MPDGALPASGVEFTLYQVKDTNELIQYFDGVSGDLEVKANSYFVDGDYSKGVTTDVASKWHKSEKQAKMGLLLLETSRWVCTLWLNPKAGDCYQGCRAVSGFCTYDTYW